MKVYLILGETGEYADRTDWIYHKVFTDRKLAEQHLQQLMTNLPEFYSKEALELRYSPDQFSVFERIMLAKDPDFRYDYTGTMYTLIEKELV